LYDILLTCCSITSSAEHQRAESELNAIGQVNESLAARPMDITLGGPVNDSLGGLVAGAIMNSMSMSTVLKHGGSLRDLLNNNVNIQVPLMSGPLDTTDSEFNPDDAVTGGSVTAAVTANPPSYEMAVADSNRHTQHLQQQQQLVMTSEPLVMTDSCAKTRCLLSGGNTIMLVPQVFLSSVNISFIVVHFVHPLGPFWTCHGPNYKKHHLRYVVKQTYDKVKMS